MGISVANVDLTFHRNGQTLIDWSMRVHLGDTQLDVASGPMPPGSWAAVKQATGTQQAFDAAMVQASNGFWAQVPVVQYNAQGQPVYLRDQARLAVQGQPG